MSLIKKAKPADAIVEEEELALPDGPAEEPLPTATAVVPEEVDDPADAETLAALAAVPTEPAEAGAESLLDMFSTVGIQTEDRSLLLGLAGEVEMHDLISELGLVAAALGVVKGQHAAAEIEVEEALAA